MRVTVAEAVQLSGRSRWTVKKYMNAGELPVHSKPTPRLETWVIDTNELLALLQEKRRRYASRRHVPGPGRGNHRKVTE